VVVPLVSAFVRTFVHPKPSVETWRSNRLCRALPLYAASRTYDTLRGVPRSYWIHCPSPLADQRVARLPSTVLPGTLPSFVLAVTPPADGVMFVIVPPPGVGVGTPPPLNSTRSRSGAYTVSL
jgi:hypothetical protein